MIVDRGANPYIFRYIGTKRRTPVWSKGAHPLANPLSHRRSK